MSEEETEPVGISEHTDFLMAVTIACCNIVTLVYGGVPISRGRRKN